MPGIPFRLALARGFPVSPLREPECYRVAPSVVVAVLHVPVPGFCDCRHGAAQDPYSAAPVVLGCVSGDDRDAGDLRAAAAARRSPASRSSPDTHPRTTGAAEYGSCAAPCLQSQKPGTGTWSTATTTAGATR